MAYLVSLSRCYLGIRSFFSNKSCADEYARGSSVSLTGGHLNSFVSPGRDISFLLKIAKFFLQLPGDFSTKIISKYETSCSRVIESARASPYLNGLFSGRLEVAPVACITGLRLGLLKGIDSDQVLKRGMPYFLGVTMKKLVSIVLLSVVGVGVAQAGGVELAKGRLIFRGALVQDGCALKESKVKGGNMESNLTTGGARASKASSRLALNIECPSEYIYSYLDHALSLPAGTASTMLNKRGVLSLDGQIAEGYSSFTPSSASGSNVGVLAPDSSSPNQTMAVAVSYINKPKVQEQTSQRLNSDEASLPLKWSAKDDKVVAVPSFDLTYVKAAYRLDPLAGIATATVPFKFVYR